MSHVGLLHSRVFEARVMFRVELPFHCPIILEALCMRERLHSYYHYEGSSIT